MAKKTDTTKLDPESVKDAYLEQYFSMLENSGGADAAKRRLDMIRILTLTYKDKGDTLEDRVKWILNEYRSQVSKNGFKGITKDMIPIVEAYGSIKEKSSIILAAYWEMKNTYKKAPLLSMKRSDEIRNSILSLGEDAVREYMYYLSLWDAMQDRALIILNSLRVECLSFMYQTALTYYVYEWNKAAENIFNSVSTLIPDDKRIEFDKIVADYNEVQRNSLFGDLQKVRIEKDGEDSSVMYCDNERGEFIKEIIDLTGRVRTTLSRLKGAVDGYKRWIKDNEAEIIVPYNILEKLSWAENVCITELDNKYYQSNLKGKDADNLTDEERAITIFPKYEDVETDVITSNLIYRKLDGSRKQTEK